MIPALGFGGAERQMFELIKGLDKSRYDPHVVTLVDDEDGYLSRMQAMGVPVTCLGCAGKTDYMLAVFKLAKIIRMLGVDIVHGFLNLGSLIGSLAGRLTGTPVMSSSIRDARDKTRLTRYLRRITALFSDVFTSNSKKGFDNRYRRWGRNFEVVYNGIELSRFQYPADNGTQKKSELGIAADKHCVVMVASLTPHKDHSAFIDVAAAMSARRSDIVWLIIGDGPLRAKLEQDVRERSLERDVIFLGSRKDVDSIWPAVTVSMLLTNFRIFEEGLPNAVLESMASGVPAIATDSGGTVEVIDNDVNGYLVDNTQPEAIAAKLESLIEDKPRYQRFSTAARHKVESVFAYEKYIQRNVALYERLLKAH